LLKLRHLRRQVLLELLHALLLLLHHILLELVHALLLLLHHLLSPGRHGCTVMLRGNPVEPSHCIDTFRSCDNGGDHAASRQAVHHLLVSRDNVSGILGRASQNRWRLPLKGRFDDFAFV
jgi:hypothetical protein